MIISSNSLSRGSGMPNQVDGALVRTPCPVPSCPACEPNSGSVLPSLSTKATRVEGGPTLLCNHVGTGTHFTGNRVNRDLARAGDRPDPLPLARIQVSRP